MSLMIHSGGYFADALELASVPLPIKTKTYQPVGHFELVEIVKDISSQTIHGYALSKERYGLNRKGQEMFGHLTFLPTEAPGIATSPRDLDLAIGVVNSYNKRVRVKFASGAKVVVCDNMLFLGDVTYTRKHTPNVIGDVKEAVLKALSRAKEAYEVAKMDATVMQHITISDDQATALLGVLFGRKALDTPQLSKALKNWRKPKYPEFESRSLWSLYNATNAAMANSKPDKIMERHISLHDLFVDFVNHRGAIQ